MKKRLIALCCAATMLLSLAACGSKTSETTSTPDEQDETVVYKVGICQLVTHDALDAATQGFQDALNELLPGPITRMPPVSPLTAPPSSTALHPTVWI